jgi:hypothetical protein
MLRKVSDFEDVKKGLRPLFLISLLFIIIFCNIKVSQRLKDTSSKSETLRSLQIIPTNLLYLNFYTE